MSTKSKVMLGLSVLAMGASFAGSAEAKESGSGAWEFRGSGSGLVEGAKYTMHSSNLGWNLYWKDAVGVNARFSSTVTNNIKLKRKSGSGPIKCGELFAIQFAASENASYTHLHYGHQTLGINLTSDVTYKDEYAQWKFTNCQEGSVIAPNSKVTLTNTKANDTLMGALRPGVADLAWASDVVCVAGKCIWKG